MKIFYKQCFVKYSLRRGRLDEPKKKEMPATMPLNKTRTYNEAPLPKPVPSRAVKRDPPPTPSPSFSRTDCGRFSMRTRPTPTVCHTFNLANSCFKIIKTYLLLKIINLALGNMLC